MPRPQNRRQALRTAAPRRAGEAKRQRDGEECRSGGRNHRHALWL